MLEKDHYLSWGTSSGGVAAGRIEIGAAVMFNPDDFIKRIDDGKQALLISKPRKHLEHWITSANSKEAELNTLQAFRAFVDARSH
ncbi:hypothetical protein [Pelagicoccus mobilis]|uniref:Uncharacterized protein n=1 Tax=Pelagicoccus mobilis TaxID=415221 RepID=A0A934VMR3_9BACT|nr:hypothetical protein [Pelagicoccus mobilis]MBK1875452.1 hypothetical protein [Pelagicoccus mobilis]